MAPAPPSATCRSSSSPSAPAATRRAPAVELPAPRLRVESQSVGDGQRRLQLRVSSPRGAPCFYLWHTSGAKILGTRIAGHPVVPLVRFSPETDAKLWELVAGRSRSDWKLHFCGLDGDGVRIDLRLASAAQLSLRLVDISYGFPPGLPVASRPAHLIPYENSDVTLVSRAVLVSE